MRNFDYLVGKIAASWRQIGIAYVVDGTHPLSEFNGGIIVAKSLDGTLFSVISFSGRIHGIIVEDGVDEEIINYCKQKHIPLLVECKQATQCIVHKETIEIDTETSSTDKGTCQPYVADIKTNKRR